MKKTVIFVAATAAMLFAPQAFAQAKNFQGFSVAADINITSSSVEHGTTASGSDGNVDVQAQYAFALGEKFVLGLGASAGLSNYKIAANAKMTKTTSVFVTPGYAVSNTLLVYGKLGTTNGTFDIDSGPKVDMTGTAYGIGVKSTLNKNLFGQAELVLNQFSDKVSSAGLNTKAQVTYITLGIGYQF
jgi:hypothetical protein